MAKYSGLGNVKFTLRIVVPEWLCGCEPALARMIVVPEWLNSCEPTLARMIVVPEWLRGSI